MIKCFRKFISVMQDKNGEQVSQVSRITLRFQCESKLEVYPQKWGSGLRMFYVMLHAPARNKKRERTRIQFVAVDGESNSGDKTHLTFSTSEVTTSKAV